MVVLRILIQHKLTKLLHGKLLSWPDLRHIEWIKPELFRIRILRLHDLHHSSPFNFLPLFNRLPEITLGEVRIFATHLCGFALSELLLTVLGDEVVLDVDKSSLSIHPLKSVTAITMVVPPSNRRPMITEKHQTSVIGLRCVCKQVKQGWVVN